MAITSYPFDAQAVTETQFSQMFREFQESGVVASFGGAGFTVTANTGMALNVSSGLAFLRGFMVQSTATEVVTIPAAGTSVRVDRVVLRLDPSLNSIVLAVKQGTAGSTTPPALTQTDTAIYELPLAQVTVNASVTSITSADIARTRPFVGTRIQVWNTLTRPASARMGQIGYNADTSAFEFWNDTAWTPLISNVSWSTLTGKPTTFAPSAHTHLWADITDRPSSLPPSAHTHDWTQVTGKPTSYVPSAHGHAWTELTGVPSTFAPSSHTHAWSSITSKPSTFTPASHTHSSYLESGDTISWANGTKRVHNDSVSGSGTYYAVWVQGDGTFARNTSSRRFKQNIRDIDIDPEAVLALRPRVYDRRPKEEGSDDYLRDEFGLIAEEVAETLPEIVTYDDEGRIDALRYDLLGVALLSVVQDQADRIERLEDKLRELSR
ncbi:tail fiber domain-containing protein [Streptomyces prunicolor]|uniref:tail fiber domain-containing protein n=1 Tax=Streptomyces prunicolor TaxID=67348 RepID=UPI002252C072|nr:tail fiber domain-containing protein [Streptomyces prunicolor]MCX5237218.1 tail fiber domain-containing protein [Streptomyces prunicolor]